MKFSQLGRFLAGREAKFSKSLLLLAISLACGIAALVALETFSRRVDATVGRDSRKVLAADFQVQAWRPFDEKVWAAVAEEKQAGHTALLNDFVSTLTMPGIPALSPITVSVRAVEGAYPFYGDFITEPQVKVSALSEAPTLIVDQSLSARGLQIGSRVKLGDAEFRIAAYLMEEPQSVMASFSLGPRVILSTKWLGATGLVRPGARIFQKLLVKSPLDSEAFEKKFRASAPDLHWRIVTPERANRQVERVMSRMSGFLSFVGVASLFLGTMGLFMVFRSQFLRRLPTYLTLRCLGAKNGAIVQAALVSSIRVAVLGSILGVLAGLGLERALLVISRSHFRVDLATVSYWPSFAWGFFLSFLCVALSVYLPLREVLRVPVSGAIREEEAGATRLHKKDALIGLLVAALIIFLVGPGVKMSLIILGGLALAVILLLGTGFVLLRALARVRFSFALRHAQLQLERKQGRTQLLIITFGMSLFFLFLILFMGSSLRRQLDIIERKDIPNLFALNVPSDRRADLEALLPEATFVPVAQARIVQLNGREIVEGQVPEEGEERFFQTREYVITKRSELSKGEEIVGGDSLFGPSREGVVQISLEKVFSDRLGLKVGDELKIDLAGVRLDAIVSSFRKVNWFNFQPNFFMLFNPAEIEGAPMDFVAFSRVPREEIARYQSEIVKVLPQVTLLDGEALAARLLSILGQLSLAVYAVTLFSLLACAFVFLGIFLARRSEILKEVGLWRCLGLRNNKILGIYTAESLFLGLLAAVSSFCSALLVVYAISRFVIDIPVELIAAHWIAIILILPAILSALGAYALLRGMFKSTSQSLLRQAEET